MAYIATNPSASLSNPFARLGNRVLSALVRMAERDSRYQHMQALMAMSDEQLAERGLRRDDIPARVFGGSYYL